MSKSRRQGGKGSNQYTTKPGGGRHVPRGAAGGLAGAVSELDPTGPPVTVEAMVRPWLTATATITGEDGSWRIVDRLDDTERTESGGKAVTVTQVSTEWEERGETWSGDYDPRDPNNVALLRFQVKGKDAVSGDWVPLDHGSACTRLPVDSDTATQVKGLALIHNEILGRFPSIDKATDDMSYLSDTMISDNFPAGSMPAAGLDDRTAMALHHGDQVTELATGEVLHVTGEPWRQGGVICVPILPGDDGRSVIYSDEIG